MVAASSLSYASAATPDSPDQKPRWPGRWSSRSGTRRDGQTRPLLAVWLSPHRRARRSHRCRIVDSHARTLTFTRTPDTGHRTRGRDRVLGQGDLDTAGTGQISRTTTTTRPPAGTPNRGPGDGTCCARQRRRLGDDEVPASARLPTALPGACSVALSAKPRPGALLSSDDFGSSVERTATLHPLWRCCSGGCPM